MFESISNNFGAGVIQFKDVQESNYIVLNAKFTVDSGSDAYKAAKELEITVPDLTIERSALGFAVCQYKDRRSYSSGVSVYDGGTVLKSWVKDKNTIVIEKLDEFDDRGELTFWIHSLYCQLNQGGNTIRGTKTRITFEAETKYVYWSYDSFCVIFDKWVLLHAQISSTSWSGDKYDWPVTFKGLPEDIDTEIPVMLSVCYGNDKLGGVNPTTLKAGLWTSKAEDREMGFGNTGSYPFLYAYIIRDGETTSDDSNDNNGGYPDDYNPDNGME